LLVLVGWFAVEDVRWLESRFRRRGETADGPAIEIGVRGMTCDGCAAKLERALRSESGVTDVDVQFASGKAVIHGTAETDRLRAAIERAGFTPA